VWRGGSAKANTEARSKSLDEWGYIRIRVKGKRYRAHRLAWFYVHGIWPTNQIDHINGNKEDNRIANLRDVPQTHNQWNSFRRRDNTSGYKGVRWHKASKKWSTSIRINGKNEWLGTYSTPEKAHEAYCKAAKESRGEFARFK